MAALAVAGHLGAHHLPSVAIAGAAGVVVAGKLGAVGVLSAQERAACRASKNAGQRAENFFNTKRKKKISLA